MIARSALAAGDEAALAGSVRAPRAMSARQSRGGVVAGAVSAGVGRDGRDGADIVGGDATARGDRGAGASRSGTAAEGAGDAGRRTADDGLMIVMGVTVREDVGKRTSVGMIRTRNHASK